MVTRRGRRGIISASAAGHGVVVVVVVRVVVVLLPSSLAREFVAEDQENM